MVVGLSLAAFAGTLLIIPLMAGRGALEMLLNVVAGVGLLTGIAGLFLAVIWQRTLAGSRPR